MKHNTVQHSTKANSSIAHKLPKQRGLAAMITSMALLAAATTATFVTSKKSSSVMRSSNNMYQSQQAFEAAEAGLEFATNYLKQNQSSIVVDSNSSGYIDSNSTSGSLSGANTNYTFSFTNIESGNLELIKVTAVGTSSDGQITRTVSQLLGFNALFKLASTPQTPVTAKNNITMKGNSSVNNNAQSLGLWSGGCASISGSADINTTGSNNTQDNDNNLYNATVDELFKNYFGAPMATIKSESIVQVSNGSNIDGTSGLFHWIESPSGGKLKINGNTTIGTVNNPVIIVVEGDMKISGNATVNGFVFVTGDFVIKGTAKLNGAIVTNGDFTSKGNSDTSYDHTILSNTAASFGTYAKIPGSWNDH